LLVLIHDEFLGSHRRNKMEITKKKQEGDSKTDRGEIRKKKKKGQEGRRERRILKDTRHT